LTIRIDELDKLRPGVAAQARAALPGAEPSTEQSEESPSDPTADAERGADATVGTPQEDIVRHALERLEAALRARTATGFRLR
jgi:hypothetical protein